jgi:hypothetical protein
MKRNIFAACVLMTISVIHARQTMASPTNRIEALFKNVRTVCVGRFLIDVPSTASTSFGLLWIPLEVDRYPGQAHELDTVLAESAENLKAELYLATGPLRGTANDLGRVIDGAVKGQKTFIGLSRMSGHYYAINSYVPVGNDVFVLHGNNLADPSNYQADLTQLNETAIRITPRNTETLTESGFCIDGALIKDASVQEVERVHFGIQLAEFSDVVVSLSMVMKNIEVKSDKLEPRFREAEQAAIKSDGGAWHKRIKFLRRGTRAMTPWTGDEILMHVPPHARDGHAHQFMFVALGEPKNIYIPTLDVSLNTGVQDNRRGAVAPSITDEEALYLWDRLLNSLRVRPVGSAAP